MERLDPKAVARAYGVTASCVRAWVRTGALAADRTPGLRISIPAAAVPPTRPADPDRLLRAAKLAAALGVCRQTVARWVASGRLRPAARTPGGVPLYRVRDALTTARRNSGIRSCASPARGIDCVHAVG